MIKLCVFDLDGTLINSLMDLAKSMNYALVLNGYKAHKLSAYNKFVGDGLNILIQRAVYPEAIDEAILNKIRDDFNSHYKLHCFDNTVVYSGIFEMLKRFNSSNIKIAVLSNKPHQFAEEIVFKMFDEIQFYKVLGHSPKFPKKPSPLSLLDLLKSADIKNSECLYVGDSDVDIKTAQNASVKSCGVSWGFRGREELIQAAADYVIDSPEQIFSVLEELFYK